MEYRGKHARSILTKVDVAGLETSCEQQVFRFQPRLLDVLEIAATQAGLDRDRWTSQAEGAGELAVGEEDERHIVNDYVSEVYAALIQHNRGLAPETKLRLRMAVHFGAARREGSRFIGKGVVFVGRLAGSDPFKNVLRTTDADLAVLLSEHAYQDTILEGHGLSPAQLREVTAIHKDFREPAWLYVPGHDVHSLDLWSAVVPIKAATLGTPSQQGPSGRQTQHLQPSASLKRLLLNHRQF